MWFLHLKLAGQIPYHSYDKVHLSQLVCSKHMGSALGSEHNIGTRKLTSDIQMAVLVAQGLERQPAMSNSCRSGVQISAGTPYFLPQPW